MPSKKNISNKIETLIYNVRGARVMLDSDLADLYKVETRTLIQAMKRNTSRFPKDFAFQLSKQELMSLRSQIVISKKQDGRGGRRHTPYVFTEHGAIMLANILNSPAAVDMSVHVVRAFVRIRHTLAENKELANELGELKKQLKAKFSEYDQQFQIVFDAINRLFVQEEKEKRSIGFDVK